MLASGNFELQILEISNPKSSLLSETCCGLPYQLRDTKITGAFTYEQMTVKPHVNSLFSSPQAAHRVRPYLGYV